MQQESYQLVSEAAISEASRNLPAGHQSLTSSWQFAGGRQSNGCRRSGARQGWMDNSALATVDEGLVQQAGKPPGRRKLILIVVTVFILILVASGLWLSGLLQHHVNNTTRSHTASIAEQPTLINIPDIVTNLDNGARRAVFIKLKTKIEVANKNEQGAIDADMPRILDAFQTYLRSLHPEELHGGEGVYRLREAMLNRINVITNPVQVSDVLFVEMLVQ